MAYKYSTKIDDKNSGKAIGLSLPISTKFSIEICNFIRGKELEKGKKMLEAVIKKKRPLPLKRFKGDIGHKRGIDKGPGRYPIKACGKILDMINSAEANAQFKGLSTENLMIRHICAQRAAAQWRFGRQRRRKMKRTHIEVVLEEKEGKKESKKEKKSTKEEKKQKETPAKKKGKKEDKKEK